MSRFRISKETQRNQTISMQEVNKIRRDVIRFIRDNPNRRINITDIAREVAEDKTMRKEVDRIRRVIYNMKEQGLIAVTGGKTLGHWSEVYTTRRTEPTYVKPSYDEDTEDIDEEVQEESQPEIKDGPKVEENQGPIIQEAEPVPQEKEQVHQATVVERKPKSITITINLNI